MSRNYIDKILAIGKKESCTAEDFSFFASNLPDSLNREILHSLQTKYGITLKHWARRDILSVDLDKDSSLENRDKKQVFFLIDLIKGLHLIMLEAGYGRSSTTITCSLFYTLIKKDARSFIGIYDWIAQHGGNYYIEPDVTFKKARKQEIVRLAGIEKEKQRMADEHLKAEGKKRLKREDHSKRSAEKNKEREFEIKKLKRLDKLKQLRHIISSSYPLDFYPTVFAKINTITVKKLSREEAQNLKNKLKTISKKSPWKNLLKYRLLKL